MMKQQEPLPLQSEALWTAFKSGSRAAYTTIYQQHFFALLDYGRKISPEREQVKDAIQDLFIELWQQREKLADTTSIRYYLLQALKYKLYRNKTATFYETNPMLVEPSVETQWIQQEISDQQQRNILFALEKVLSARQREAVQLKFFQQLNNEEIAQRMQISRESVYNLVSKALVILRQSVRTGWVIVCIFFKEVLF